MKMQKLLSYTRKAVDEYQLIEEGDRIAVGISGGKDSLTMLYALQGLSRFYPKHFEVEASLSIWDMKMLVSGRWKRCAASLGVHYTVTPPRSIRLYLRNARKKIPVPSAPSCAKAL